MLVLKNLGIKRAIKELPFVILSKIIGAKTTLKILFNLHKRIEDTIDYISILNDKNNIHPKHRLTGYHRFFIERIRAEEHVLDIGCGNGAVAFDVAKATGAYVTGIDKDEKSIQFAQNKWKCNNLQFFVKDATKLNSQHYDVVILSNVLEHIEDRMGFLRKILKNIHPSKVLVRVPMHDRHWHVNMKKELGVDHRSDTAHFTEYTNESFLSEVKKAGFAIKRCENHFGEIWAELTI